MRESVGSILQPLARQLDHGVGYVDSVDFKEVATQRPQEPSRSAADFERCVAPRQALQIELKTSHHVRAGGEKLRLFLLAAAERHVAIGVFAGARIPSGAHAFEYVGVFHRAVVILTGCWGRLPTCSGLAVRSSPPASRRQDTI